MDSVDMFGAITLMSISVMFLTMTAAPFSDENNKVKNFEFPVKLIVNIAAVILFAVGARILDHLITMS